MKNALPINHIILEGNLGTQEMQGKSLGTTKNSASRALKPART